MRQRRADQQPTVATVFEFGESADKRTTRDAATLLWHRTIRRHVSHLRDCAEGVHYFSSGLPYINSILNSHSYTNVAQTTATTKCLARNDCKTLFALPPNCTNDGEPLIPTFWQIPRRGAGDVICNLCVAWIRSAPNSFTKRLP